MRCLPLRTSSARLASVVSPVHRSLSFSLRHFYLCKIPVASIEEKEKREGKTMNEKVEKKRMANDGPKSGSLHPATSL